MSVRAYHFDETASEVESFNLWHDRGLMDFLDTQMGFFAPMDADGHGLVDVSVTVLQNAIKAYRRLNLDEQTVAQLRKDVKAAKSSKNEIVTYNCF